MTTPLPLEAFKAGLTSQHVMTQKIIHGALAAGPLVFLAVVLLIYSGSEPRLSTPDDAELLEILSLFHLLFFITTLVAGPLLARKRLGARLAETETPAEQPQTNSDVEAVVARIRESLIVRVALFEGAAFFGLAIIMIAAVSGALHALDWVWINGLSTLVMVAYVVATFPTRDRFEHVYAMMLEQR
ncbi:MAG: hypothetical protein FJ215_10970 [Ignavibacteria bacterium]|nr:hypothetical protein [Ignavibacteria bacterium]